MDKNIILFICLLMSSSTFAGEVCLGKNLSKIADEHTKKLNVQVNDLAPAHFEHPYIKPKSIASNLNDEQIHQIKVYFDGERVTSWNLDLLQYPTRSVIIWRAAGSWRMEQNESKKCN